MKYPLSYLAAFTFPAILLFAESKEVPEIPTRTEADSIVATQEQAREHREAERKAAIEEIPASEEWEVDHGNRKTIFRRVHIPQSRDEFQIASPTGDAWTEEEIAAWIAAQPIPRSMNLSAVVYDRIFTEITWREQESGEEWTVLSNIDFRYLSGIGSFEDENHHWQTFLFVDEVDSEKEKEIARRAHTLQMQGESQISNSEFQIASSPPTPSA
ncbi:MAG: hypothetical protein LAT55_06040 [Opitutales bacterium]|nr:hypothetical protein [Opitutales bacterium]